MVKAVLFDMDGVIVDSEPPQMRVFDMLLRREGVVLRTEEFFEYAGKRTIDNFRVIVPRYGLKRTPEEYVEEKNRLYYELLEREGIEANPGVRELVEALRSAGVALAVVSGSPRRDIELVLSLTGLREAFPVVVAAEDVVRGKPDPEGFLKAAGILGVRPAEAWVVEDSEAGVKAAKAGGFRVVAVPTRYTAGHDFSSADRVAKDLFEVRRMLLG